MNTYIICISNGVLKSQNVPQKKFTTVQIRSFITKMSLQMSSKSVLSIHIMKPSHVDHLADKLNYNIYFFKKVFFVSLKHKRQVKL